MIKELSICCGQETVGLGQQLNNGFRGVTLMKVLTA